MGISESRSSRATRRGLFSSLPFDCLVEIIMFLGKEDILKLMYVNKRIFSILRNEIVFKRLSTIKFGENISTNLPKSIMERYYDDSYRRMYFMDNKYRFHHYGVHTFNSFNILNTNDIREFDKNDDFGFNLEEEVVKICQYYSNESDDYEDGTQPPIDLEEALSREYFDTDKICLWRIAALQDTENETPKIDERFPIFNIISEDKGMY